MQNKTFQTATALVKHVLNSKLNQGATIEALKNDSQYGILKFYQLEILPLVHLCARPVTFQNVNRRVEEFIKTKSV